MRTSKSTLSVARVALRAATQALPTYSCPKSPHRFTQPQLLACLVLREFLRLDYRGLAATLGEWGELRQALGLARVPHWTTFQKAAARFQKKRRGPTARPDRRAGPPSSEAATALGARGHRRHGI